MSALSTNQLQILAERLQARRFELLEDIMVPVRETRRQEALQLDKLLQEQQDARVANAIVDLNPENLQGEVERLRGVQAAIERMEGGTYGNCTECGRPINPDRLNLQPSVTRCTECEEKSDTTKK